MVTGITQLQERVKVKKEDDGGSGEFWVASHTALAILLVGGYTSSRGYIDASRSTLCQRLKRIEGAPRNAKPLHSGN
jgi:hypothetical protein